MRDEKGRDAKILAVPAGDPRQTWTEIDELPRHRLLEISHFFDIYKDLEPGKSSDVHGWEGRKEAEQEVERSRKRFQETDR
jgi:inorganic pyrophosphatase